MRIRSLYLNNFRGYGEIALSFGNFNCLIGDNGCGKTTILDCVSLLCSSLDFREAAVEDKDFPARATPADRLRQYLQKNIRYFGQPEGAKGFLAKGIFEHEGKDYVVELSESGFQKNELLEQPWWWSGMTYFAKFDIDMVNFQLAVGSWPQFAKAYEGIFGFKVEPDIYTETDLVDSGVPEEDAKVVIGFYLLKPDGKVYSRYASAGEKKIAKTLSQVLNLPPEKAPAIVLVDNLELHVTPRRHLSMFDAVKNLFEGKQVVSTTHSETVVRNYEPKDHLIDIEKEKQCQSKNCSRQ